MRQPRGIEIQPDAPIRPRVLYPSNTAPAAVAAALSAAGFRLDGRFPPVETNQLDRPSAPPLRGHQAAWCEARAMISAAILPTGGAK